MDIMTSMAIQDFRNIKRAKRRLEVRENELNQTVARLTDEQRAEYFRETEKINRES
jgi:hypothetical protein